MNHWLALAIAIVAASVGRISSRNAPYEIMGTFGAIRSMLLRPTSYK